MSSSHRLTDLLPSSELTSLLHVHKFASPPISVRLSFSPNTIVPSPTIHRLQQLLHISPDPIKEQHITAIYSNHSVRLLSINTSVGHPDLGRHIQNLTLPGRCSLFSSLLSPGLKERTTSGYQFPHFQEEMTALLSHQDYQPAMMSRHQNDHLSARYINIPRYVCVAFLLLRCAPRMNDARLPIPTTRTTGDLAKDDSLVPRSDLWT